jgi:predicted nucleic-acid-binding protein
MRGLDTNVLLRFFTQEDPEQARIATDLISGAEDQGERLHISTIALCELVWVLRSAYRIRRDGIVSTIESLLGANTFEIQDRDLVRRALESYRSGKADFADYLIGWQDRRAGCSETLTFDGGLKGTDGFHFLG